MRVEAAGQQIQREIPESGLGEPVCFSRNQRRIGAGQSLQRIVFGPEAMASGIRDHRDKTVQRARPARTGPLTRLRPCRGRQKNKQKNKNQPHPKTIRRLRALRNRHLDAVVALAPVETCLTGRLEAKPRVALNGAVLQKVEMRLVDIDQIEAGRLFPRTRGKGGRHTDKPACPCAGVYRAGKMLMQMAGKNEISRFSNLFANRGARRVRARPRFAKKIVACSF